MELAWKEVVLDRQVNSLALTVKFQPQVNQFKGEIQQVIRPWRAQHPSITLTHSFHVLDGLKEKSTHVMILSATKRSSFCDFGNLGFINTQRRGLFCFFSRFQRLSSFYF